MAACCALVAACICVHHWVALHAGTVAIRDVQPPCMRSGLVLTGRAHRGTLVVPCFDAMMLLLVARLLCFSTRMCPTSAGALTAWCCWRGSNCCVDQPATGGAWQCCRLPCMSHHNKCCMIIVVLGCCRGLACLMTAIRCTDVVALSPRYSQPVFDPSYALYVTLCCMSLPQGFCWVFPDHSNMQPMPCPNRCRKRPSTCDQAMPGLQQW